MGVECVADGFGPFLAVVKVSFSYLGAVSHLFLGFGPFFLVAFGCHADECGNVFGIEVRGVGDESDGFGFKFVVSVRIFDDNEIASSLSWSWVRSTRGISSSVYSKFRLGSAASRRP